MVEFTVNKNDFKIFIGALNPTLFECEIDIGSEQLHVEGLDTSKVCFVTVDYFKNLNATDIDKVYLYLSKVKDFINKCKEDNIYVTTTKQVASFECGNMHLDIKLFKNLNDERSPPTIPTTVDANLDNKQFYNAIKSINNVNERVKFTMLSDCMLVNVSDENDLYEWRIDIENTNDDLVNEIVSSYSYEFINDISAGLKHFETVNIKFGNDMPLILSGHDDLFDIEYILAPRIV